MEESSSTVLLDSFKVQRNSLVDVFTSADLESVCFRSLSFVLSAVHLVQLHDAAGPVGPGAAPPAAEAEAAARSWRHEPPPLKGSRRRRFVSGCQNNHQETWEEKNSLTKTSSNLNGKLNRRETVDAGEATRPPDEAETPPPTTLGCRGAVMPLLDRRARDLFKPRRRATVGFLSTCGNLNIEEHNPPSLPPLRLDRCHSFTSLTWKNLCSRWDKKSDPPPPDVCLVLAAPVFSVSTTAD